jgi:hypothetical protein
MPPGRWMTCRRNNRPPNRSLARLSPDSNAKENRISIADQGEEAVGGPSAMPSTRMFRPMVSLVAGLAKSWAKLSPRTLAIVLRRQLSALPDNRRRGRHLRTLNLSFDRTLHHACIRWCNSYMFVRVWERLVGHGNVLYPSYLRIGLHTIPRHTNVIRIFVIEDRTLYHTWTGCSNLYTCRI